MTFKDTLNFGVVFISVFGAISNAGIARQQD
jgi:hypothetical protein